MRIVFACMLLGLGGCGADPVPHACSVDGECPLHQLCDSGRCVSGCLAASDCAGASCGDHGRCVPASGDGALGADGSGPLPGADLSSGADLAGAGGVDLGGVDLGGVDLGGVDLGGVDLAYVDAWICTGACPDAALEPNNTTATATVEAAGVPLPELAICPRNDLDFYKVTAAKAGTLTAALTDGPCGPALDVAVLAANGTTVLGASVATSGGATASAAVAKNEVRYVRVSARTAGDQNIYWLKLDVN